MRQILSLPLYFYDLLFNHQFEPTLKQQSYSVFAIRLYCLLFMTSVFIWQITFIDSLWANMIDLWLWAFVLCWLYFILVVQQNFLNNSKIKSSGKQANDRLSSYILIVYELAFVLQLPTFITFIIFCGYWFHYLDTALSLKPYIQQLLFPYIFQYLTFQIIMLNICLHIGPLICLSIQLLYNSISFRPIRLVLVVTFYCLYLLINMIYSLSVKPVFRYIDWQSLISLFLCLGGLLLVCMMHLFGRFVYIKWKCGVEGDKQKLSEKLMEIQIVGELSNDNDISTNV